MTIGRGQCSQGQLSKPARTSREEVCSPADVDGHSGESTRQAGRDGGETGRRYAAVMTTAMAASMTDLKTVLVGVAGGPRSSSSGQLPQTQPRQQSPQNTNSRFVPNKPFGHVTLNNPPPSRAECYECKEVGHFARDCPKRTIKSDHLNWVQPELQ